MIKEDIESFIKLDEGMKLEYEVFGEPRGKPDGEGKKPYEKRFGGEE